MSNSMLDVNSPVVLVLELTPKLVAVPAEDHATELKKASPALTSFLSPQAKAAEPEPVARR